MFERSALILAGGGSRRMNSDKGLRTLGGEPLVRHVVRLVSGLVDETLVVVGSIAQREAYEKILEMEARLIVDAYEGSSPLVGALTGLSQVGRRYALITGCDSPFISPQAIELLFEGCKGFDGATFQWPNGWIEPLMAVYRVEPSLKLAHEAYKAGDLRLRRVLHDLPRLKLIPVERLQAFDPQLLTFYDVDTEEALLEAEAILEKLRRHKNASSEKGAAPGAILRIQRDKFPA